MQRKLRALAGAAIVIIVLAGAAWLEAWWYEPLHPVVSEYAVELPGLPEGLAGFTLVQLSDLHRHGGGLSDEAIKRAVALANRARPDVAVVTGDFAGSDPRDYKPCAALLKQLKAPKGIFAVLGNHDHWVDDGYPREALRLAGIRLLDNEHVEIAPGLVLAGLDDELAGRPDERRALAGVPKGAALVILAHEPRTCERVKERTALLLVGHTHGGQVNLPLLARNKLPGLRGAKWIAGWYREGRVLMYVNRGIGMIPPRVRFRCRPEVSVFRLYPAKGKEVEVEGRAVK